MSIISLTTPTLKKALRDVLHPHNVRTMTVLSKQSGEEYKKMVRLQLTVDSGVSK